MPLKGLLIEDQRVPFAQIPPNILPPEIVQALAPQVDREGIHLTDLTVCPFKVVRDKRLGFYLPVASAYRMIRGKAWDALCSQNKRPNTAYQMVYRKFLNGHQITGTPDIVDVLHQTIEDYKAPERVYKELPLGYLWQLNGYSWLAPFRVKELILHVCGPAGYKRMDVPVWDTSDTYTFLCQRLDHYLSLMSGDVPELCKGIKCIYCRGKVAYET